MKRSAQRRVKATIRRGTRERAWVEYDQTAERRHHRVLRPQPREPRPSATSECHARARMRGTHSRACACAFDGAAFDGAARTVKGYDMEVLPRRAHLDVVEGDLLALLHHHLAVHDVVLVRHAHAVLEAVVVLHPARTRGRSREVSRAWRNAKGPSSLPGRRTWRVAS